MAGRVKNHQMASAQAIAAAVSALKELHPDDWERLYGDAREANGLPRFVGSKSLMDENRRLRARITELESRDA